MLRYEEYTDKELDACEISEEQMEYRFALGLTRACTQIGK